MAYYQRNQPLDEALAAYCDDCAVKGIVPFDSTGHQLHPWCWCPVWGGIVSIPESDWEKHGISQELGKGLCHQCGKPC